MDDNDFKELNTAVCNSDRNGRILNYDQSGRSFLFGFRLKVLPIRRALGVQQLSLLSELKIGETGVLTALDLPESVQNHLMHMGFVPDALVTALRRAPAGDPTVFSVSGLEIALRHETAEAIRIRTFDPNEAASPEFSEAPEPEAPELAEVHR